MKQATELKSVMIGGKSYRLDWNQERVYYRGEWLEIQDDQDGKKYIHPSGQRTVYLDEESQPEESKEPLGITPGEWECTNNTKNGASAAIWANCPYTVIIATGDENREKVLTDFRAICNAVNGTYKKGYDPTQMDALYKALEFIEGKCHSILQDWVNDKTSEKDFRKYIGAIAETCEKVLKTAKTINQ